MSSDAEDSPSSAGTDPFPQISTCWSDSDGRRSTFVDDESPWWVSADEKETMPERAVAPELLGMPSPSQDCRHHVTSSSSLGTPPWWPSSSSREHSTVTPSSDIAGKEVDTCREGGCEADSGKWDKRPRQDPSTTSSRKRTREQSQLGSGVGQPPVSKPKQEPLSPHGDPCSLLQGLIRSGTPEPLQSFCVFFTTGLLGTVCRLTNQRGWETVLRDASVAQMDGTWQELTLRELYAFLAVVLIMRRHRDVCFGDFWRERCDSAEPWPKRLMKRGRFLTLLWLLKCDDEVIQAKPSEDGFPIQADGMSAFSHFFERAKSVLEVFFAEFDVQFSEDVLLRDGPANAGNFKHLMRVTKAEVSSNANQTEAPRDDKDATQPVDEKGFTIVESAGQDEISLDPVCEHASRDPLSSPPREQNGASPRQQVHRSTVMDVRWRDGCLTVTTTDCPKPRVEHPGMTEAGESTRQSASREVFVPCPELVYKDYVVGNLSSLESSCAQPLPPSFLYHYLELAVYFSASEVVKHFARGPTGVHSERESVDRIVDGLAALGKPDFPTPEDSWDDEEEEDGFGEGADSTSTDLSEADERDGGEEKEGMGGGTGKPHGYVQAWSGHRRRCALCWSLHREERLVRIRCARCSRHFCLTRFRNCMKEAHDDSKVMQQLWEEDTGPGQGTGDAK